MREGGFGKRVLCLLLFCFLAFAGAQGQSNGTGHIDLSLSKCPFENAVYVYDTPSNQTQKPVGWFGDKTPVKISFVPAVRGYYLVDGNEYDGTRRIGYVEKSCVRVDETEMDVPAPRPAPTLHSGLVVAYPLNLGEKHEVMIGTQSGECTASSTKELSCKGLPDFQAIITSQAGHEYLLGCQSDGYETCVNLPVGTYRVTVHGRSVTVWNSGMERVNTQTGKKIGNITPVFSVLALIK